VGSAEIKAANQNSIRLQNAAKLTKPKWEVLK
jgi:hypothetical protein